MRSTTRATLACLLLAISAILAAIPAAAQTQAVQVTVRTVGEGVLISGVQVEVGSVSLLTNDVGEVHLPLPPGQHELRFTRLGFSERTLRLDLRAGVDTLVVVQLTEEAIHSEGIVVTSSRTERRIQDEPLRIEVVGREEVEEKLLMTPGDISMLLNETAGLRVQPTAPSLGGASIRIQGLRGRYTQILSDGLPLYGGQSGALGPLQIPPMDLAQVEVIKGAASALYGSTALGGVVNLISRRPDNQSELLLNQTTLNGTDAILWTAKQHNTSWGHTVLASLNRQAQADVDDDGWADLPSFRRASVRPRMFWNNGAGNHVFMTIGGMVEDREGGTVDGGTTPAGTPFAEGIETRRLDVGVLGRVLLSDARLLSVRGSAMGQRHRHLFGGTLERDTHTTAFAEATLSGQSGGHGWLLGAAVQYDGYDGQDVPAFNFGFTVPAVFAQDEYVFTRWLTVSASARLDVHSTYGTFLNPRLSLLLRPGPWVIRASAGTGYFAPSPFTEETESVGLSVLESFEDVEVERARNAMLDVGRTMGPWEFNATVFGSDIDEALVVRTSPGGLLSLSNSTGPVRTWGTELLARLHSGPLHLIATHVYTRSEEANPDGAGRREVPLTPRHTAGLIAAWEAEGTGRMGVEVYYTGQQALDNNPYRSTSEPYFILGFIGERRFGRVRVFLNAENMLDTRHTAYDRLVRPSRSPEGRWITDVWAPLEGRAINGGVRIAL